MLARDALGGETRYHYDEAGLLERKIVPDGSRIELGWNRLGPLIEEKGDPLAL